MHQGRQDPGPPLLDRQRGDLVGVPVGDEADQGALRGAVGGVVVGLVYQLVGAERGAGQPGLAPEGPVVDRLHLDDEAHRQVLVELVLASGKRWLERDPRVQGRRHGHERLPRVHLDATVGERDDRVLAVRGRPPQGADRRVQVHVVTELLGQPFGDLLHAADDPLVEDEVGVDQVREAAGGRGHEQGLQRGERVRGLRQHRAGDEQLDVVGGDPVVKTWQHYVALGLFAVLVFLFFKSFNKTVIATGLYLLLATFNGLSMTPEIITSWFRIGPVETPPFQLLSLGLLVLFLILNSDTLVNMYLDNKESKAQHKT